MVLWIALFVSFLVAFFTTPLIINFTKRFGYLDLPTKPHPAKLTKLPIPRAGGVSPLIGFLLSILLIAFLFDEFSITKNVVGIMLSSVVIVVIGLIDDKYDINPYLRLVSNFLVAGIVVGFGIGINSITNPLGGQIPLDTIVLTFSLPSYFGFFAGAHSVVLLADILAFVWIIWIMNALNWSSGVDGQLSGIATIALLILGVFSAQLLTTDQSQLPAAIISFAAAGSFLGLFPWSFYPQKIMPGYGGSTLAGFLIAVLAIISGAKLAIAFLVILIPLVDSIWAIIRRLWLKKSPVWGDSYHLHHQLLRMGWNIPQICIFYYLLSFVLGIIALRFDTHEKLFAIVIIGVVTFALLMSSFVLLRKFVRKNLWEK